MVCGSKNRSHVDICPNSSPQHKQDSHGKDKGCRNNLASKYIEHMPYVWDCNSRLAVWSDVKEILFPSCSDPECDIVLNALKIVSRYPWDDSKMQPCSPKQQMNFLRNFRLVPSGTLLVDLQFVKDKIEELWEMVWLKHGTSLDASSRRCHYTSKQWTRSVDHNQDSCDRGPSEEQTNIQECSTNKPGIEGKCEENLGSDDTLDTQKYIEKDEHAFKRIECNADADDLHTNHPSRKPSVNQLDNDCLSDCSPKKQQTLPNENSVKDKSILEYKRPTIETMEILPRRDQGGLGKLSSRTKHVLPVVKSSSKDAQAFTCGAEISATFPQLHNYLDTLTGKFVVGHKDSTTNEIRRCTCIEGRCFTNWKIKRHGWNLPWQHMTSRDMLVSWDAVVKELQRLAGKAIEVNDNFRMSSSGLIEPKDPFLCLAPENNSSSLILGNSSQKARPIHVEKYINKSTLTKLEPGNLLTPAKLYNLCQAQLRTYNEQKSVPRYQVFRLQKTNVNPTVNSPPIQKHRSSVLIPLLKPLGDAIDPIIKNDNLVARDLKLAKHDKGSGNKQTVLCVPTIQTCIGTTATKHTSYLVLPGKAEINVSTPEANISQKQEKVDRQPKKRQRIKSPRETATLTPAKSLTGFEMSSNTNQNAADSKCNDNSTDGPTVTQLLSHPLPPEKISVVQKLSSLAGKYSSKNQNALCRKIVDTPQNTNVFLRQLSQSTKQPVRRSNVFEYPTLRSIDRFDKVPCLNDGFSGSSAHVDTFDNMPKFTSFPKKTFEKYKGVWDRVSGVSCEPCGGGKVNATAKPFKSCEKITSFKASTKNKPQWDIDQIIKDHPRRIKGDSLYGISVNKTQALYASQQQNTVKENATRSQYKAYVQSSKTQYERSSSDSFQRQNLNEVLPILVKPKTLMPTTPAVKRKEADEYHQKEVWYRDESVSRPNNYVQADTLLEMVSANPFNQTVESMIALRQYNCDIDLPHGNGTIGPRSSPLPQIEFKRVSTFPPEMAANSDTNLPDLPDRKLISLASESDSSGELTPLKKMNSRVTKSTSQCEHKERNNQTKMNGTIKDVKDMLNRSKHVAKFQNNQTETGDSKKDGNELSKRSKHGAKVQTCNGNKTRSQQKDKTERALGVVNSLDELPRLSKSENCIKSKGFKKQTTSVYKSASSPGLPSSKYKVKVNDLTLTFTRLNDKNETKDEKKRQKHKKCSNESRTGKECRPQLRVDVGEKPHRVETKTTSEQVDVDFQNQQKLKCVDEFGTIFDKPTKFSPHCSILKNDTDCCQMYDVDEIAKAKKTSFKCKEVAMRTASDTNKFDRPVQHLHNKKRWLIEYQQNTRNELNSVTDENLTYHPDDLDEIVSCDSGPEESFGNTELKSDFQTKTVLSHTSLEEGYEISLTGEDQIGVSKTSTLLVKDDVLDSISRENTYFDTSDPESSDGILLVDDNGIDLIEEVVGNVASVPMTVVTTPEENAQSTIAENDEQIQQTKNDVTVNKQRKHKVAIDTESPVKDEANAPFEGSVYVFGDSKKGSSRKGSAGGVNIIRRSVRQHLSPRKSMAEVSDKAIYSGSERTPSANASKKGRKKAKTKSASKAKEQICSAKKTSTSDCYSSNMVDPKKAQECSLGESYVVTQRSWEVTKNSAKNIGRSPEARMHRPNTDGMETYRIKGGRVEQIEDRDASTIPYEDQKPIAAHAESTPPSECKVKQRNITKQDMTTANSTIQHLAAEQKRTLDIIKPPSSSRSLPSPASYPPQPIKSKADSSTMSSSSFSFVPIYTKDQKCRGGYAHMEGVTCPYVMMDGYKFVAIQDVLRMFPQCLKTCKIVRNVLAKFRGLSRTFCDWDQLYLLDQLFVLKGRSVKTGDMLLRVDSLVKHLPSIRDYVREEHLKLRRHGKTTLQCVQQQT